MEIHNLLPPLLPAETIPRSPSPQTAEEYLREFSSTQKAIVFFWHIFVEKSTSINRSQIPNLFAWHAFSKLAILSKDPLRLAV